MTREEAINLIGAKIKETQVFINCAADPEKSYPNSIKFCEALGMAIAALREQEELESKLRVLESSGWVSVEERLPNKINNKVLVYCKNGYIGFGHYENFRGVEDWYNIESGKPFREWDLEDCETYEVTHWMPLPEPPEVEV